MPSNAFGLTFTETIPRSKRASGTEGSNVALGILQFVAQPWDQAPENITADGQRVVDCVAVSETIVKVPTFSIGPPYRFPKYFREVLFAYGIVDDERSSRLGDAPKCFKRIRRISNACRVIG